MLLWIELIPDWQKVSASRMLRIAGKSGPTRQAAELILAC